VAVLPLADRQRADGAGPLRPGGGPPLRGLVEPGSLRERIFGAVLEEWDRAERGIFAVTGTSEVLEDAPDPAPIHPPPESLRRSHELRAGHDLRRLRGSGDDDPQRDAVRDLVALCVNGIAAGSEHG
jgi:phosphoenolpyruvate carboxylase